MEREKKRGNLLENLFIVILAFYPLRHISWGLDLWDTGYNYANFQYMGMEHMDPMWLFSTYLANAVGNLLMKLPRADSLIGMNFYTGLLVSALALAGYFFCVKKLKMPEWIAFLGEFVAVSLCWCPTAVLYNYLTYVLFLGCVILLYEGLTKDRPICLMLAGICLGANVLVRFSNLPQAAMILAVWAYDGADWYQERGRAGKGEESLFRRLGQHTFWCFAGYGSALLALFSYLHIRYGMANYVAGIKRLFSMTENASAYKAASMVRNTFEEYAENLYWVFRIGIILAAGLVLFAVSGRFMEKIWNITSGKAPERGAAKALWRGIRILWGAVSAAVPAWLYIPWSFCRTAPYNTVRCSVRASCF